MGHRFIGSHPDELEGGQPVEPGQFIDSLDIEASKNKQLIDDGLIIDADIPSDLPDGSPEVLVAATPQADAQEELYTPQDDDEEENT
jgi:hypothetical protein